MLVIERTTSAVLLTFLYAPPLPGYIIGGQNVIDNNITCMEKENMNIYLFVRQDLRDLRLLRDFFIYNNNNYNLKFVATRK